MKLIRRIAFPVLALVGLLAFPCVVLAQAAEGGIVAAISGPIGTAGIVAVLGALATAALTLTHFLPGWGTKLNVIAVACAGAASAIGALGPKASIIAIIIAGVGAWLGYNRSEARAAGKSVVG